MKRINHKISFIPLIVTLILLLSLAGCGQLSSSMAASIQNQTESSGAAVMMTDSPTQSAANTAPEDLQPSTTQDAASTEAQGMDEDGRFTTPEDVAAYLHTYEHLPSNFITKREAMDLGWESELGNLWDVTDECSIGGDIFGNREGLLPKESGRIWYECDVNYGGGFRGSERVVYSSDGLIYYTKDHYETFSQLY